MDFVDSSPDRAEKVDRAGGVDRDGELNRAGEVVWENTDGAEEEEWASIARGRLRGESFATFWYTLRC